MSRRKSIFMVVAGLLTASLMASSYTLDEKLQKQWERYSEARKLLVERISNETIPLSERMISRTEWEEVLKLKGEWALSEQDIQILKEIQSERIKSAKDQAILSSVIDLDQIRRLDESKSKTKIGEFCKKMPKGGMLHVHPFGTFNKETVNSLLQKKNPVLPITELIANLSNTNSDAYLYPQEIVWLNTLGQSPQFLNLSPNDQRRFLDFYVLPAGSHPFERFEAVFWFTNIAVSTWDDYYEALWDFGRRASEEGVIYVEFTNGLNAEILPYYLAVADKYETDYGITLRYNYSFSRFSTPEDMLNSAKALLNINSPMLTGIDLLANETNTPSLETGQVAYATILNAVQAGTSLLHRTQHAGELGDPRNPRDAMIMGAERIGHGVKMQEDPIVMEYASKNRIGVEINLTSNIKLRAVDDIGNHPFIKFLRLGIPVSLSTDDEGIFETDINQECETAIGSSDVTYFEMKQMAINSIEKAFVSETKKKELLKKLLNQFEIFENDYTANHR